MAVSPRKSDGKRRATSRPPAARTKRTSRPPRQTHVTGSYPEITIREAPVGRETLVAIEEELASVPPTIREKVDTIPYDERPKQPSSRTMLRGSSPEIITVSEASIGRATMDAIEDDLAHEALAAALAPPPRVEARPSASTVFEISVFVVEGEEISTRSSEKARRAFVEQRLLHRVPALSMNEVVRVSVSPTVVPNTVIVRVWSTVGPRG